MATDDAGLEERRADVFLMTVKLVDRIQREVACSVEYEPLGRDGRVCLLGYCIQEQTQKQRKGRGGEGRYRRATSLLHPAPSPQVLRRRIVVADVLPACIAASENLGGLLACGAVTRRVLYFLALTLSQRRAPEYTLVLLAALEGHLLAVEYGADGEKRQVIAL